jgi:methylamine--corrinoid protein Co-methyltransferase
MDFPGGMRTTDFHEVSQLNELKCDVGALTFTSHYNLARDNVMVEQMPIFGGFAGGLEETTIVDVAAHLNSFVTFGGTWHEDGPVHMRWGITTTREALAIAGHAIMAVNSAWPNIMSGNQYYTIAGPCTVMCLLETAAQARFMGEVAHAVAGLPTEQTNEILDALVKMYEKDYKTADQGKFYYECYDTEKVVPTDEYLEVYDKACAALKSLGVNYKLW